MSILGDTGAHERIIAEIGVLPDGEELRRLCALSVMSTGELPQAAGCGEWQGGTRPPRLDEVLTALAFYTSLASHMDAALDDYGGCLSAALDAQLAELQALQESLARGRLGGDPDEDDDHHNHPVVGGDPQHLILLDDDDDDGRATQPTTDSDVVIARAMEELRVSLDTHHYCQAYLNYFDGFLQLWAELFYPEGRPPPPQLHAVRWEALAQSEPRRRWCRSLYDSSKQLLVDILTRRLPPHLYALYTLYAGLAVRVCLLETSAQLFVWSALYADVSYCTQHLRHGYRLQEEFARVQRVWARHGLLTPEFASTCGKFNQQFSQHHGSFLSEAANDGPAGSAEGGAAEETSGTAQYYMPIFHTQCAFQWLAQRMYWSLHGRCSLLFSRCIALQLVPPPKKRFEDQENKPATATAAAEAPPADAVADAAPGEERADGAAAGQAASSNADALRAAAAAATAEAYKTATVAAAQGHTSFGFFYVDPAKQSAKTDAAEDMLLELNFLARAGCHQLGRVLRDAAAFGGGRGTFLLLADNTTRPGHRSWSGHHFTPITAPDVPAERRGLEPWVLACAVPRARLAKAEWARRRQERAVVETVVFHVTGGGGESDSADGDEGTGGAAATAAARRFRFTHCHALFYVLSSGPELDGGRLYFCLHVHSDAADPGEAESREHAATAFALLRHLRETWAMRRTCDEAVILAQRLTE